MTPRDGAASRGTAGFALVTLVLVGALIGLGVWQLQRREEKHALIAALDARLSAAPVPLPPPSVWPALDPAHDEFRRVTFAATFTGRPEANVYSSGSAVRADIGGPGVFVFAPAQLAGGGTVVINRGFVADAERARAAPPPQGETVLTGYLRFPERPGWLTPRPDAAKRLWFARDVADMAQAYGWDAVAPFYVDLEAPAPAAGVPKPGPLVVHLKDDHLQYALTWFGLAAVVAIAFGVWLAGRRRA